jgi:hypothetical protein
MSGWKSADFQSSLVLGSWFLVLGSWFLVLGSWFLVLGSWFLVSDLTRHFTVICLLEDKQNLAERLECVNLCCLVFNSNRGPHFSFKNVFLSMEPPFTYDYRIVTVTLSCLKCNT